MAFFDLHVHSAYSKDGEHTPAKLAALAAEAGLEIFALTDHNTTGGLREAADEAHQAGLDFIPAIELDCRHKGVWMHLLGYWIDPGHAELKKIEREVAEQDQRNSPGLIDRFLGLGLHLDQDRLWSLSKNGMIWGELIAEVALADERNRSSRLLAPYRLGQRRSDNPYVNFDLDFCTPGNAAYIPIEYVSLAEAVGVVKRAGGVAVLAHPGRDIKEDARLLADVAAEGLDGLEVFSSYHSPEQENFYRSQAAQLGLALSGGSDFHGKTKPSIALGSVACPGEDEGALLRALAGLAIPSAGKQLPGASVTARNRRAF